MQLLKLLWCFALTAIVRGINFSKLPISDSTEEIVVAMAVAPSALAPPAEFPPRIVFCGIRFWDRLIDVSPE